MPNQSKSSTFLWSSVIVILVLVVLGIYFAVSSSSDEGPKATTILETLSENDWVKGNADSSVTLIEYSDFQCPGCAGFHPVLKQLQAELGTTTFKIVYRHFPIAGHANARIASRAAEAAGNQGKFWEMHDMLFETQKSWERSGDADKIFTDYARTLGLDITKFETDLRSKEVGEKIQAQYESGLRFGVNSTPTFFLNNTKLEFPRTYIELKSKVQEAINSANGTPNATSTATTTRN